MLFERRLTQESCYNDFTYEALGQMKLIYGRKKKMSTVVAYNGLGAGT